MWNTGRRTTPPAPRAIASRSCRPIARSATSCCCASANGFQRSGRQAADESFMSARLRGDDDPGCLGECLPIGSARIRSQSSLKIKVRMLGRPKFVLASGSPRRLSLLNQAGIEPDALRPADVDETPRRGELPRACANPLARAKARAALKSVQLDDELRRAFILAAHTLVPPAPPT